MGESAITLRRRWIVCGVCVVIGAALLFFSGCVSGGVLRRTLRLADGGKPLADIVIAPDADENLKFAAAELKEHLDKITGGDFAIVNSPREGKKHGGVSAGPRDYVRRGPEEDLRGGRFCGRIMEKAPEMENFRCFFALSDGELKFFCNPLCKTTEAVCAPKGDRNIFGKIRGASTSVRRMLFEKDII